MTQPILKDIAAGMEAWDAEVNANTAIMRDGPMPLHVFVGTTVDMATEFPPAQYADCLLRNGGHLYISNGTVWKDYGVGT